MNKTRTAFLIAAMLAGGSAMAQGAAGLVSERSISTNAALELATTSWNVAGPMATR